MTLHTFYLFLIVMAVVALAVYVSLFFVDAGYGKFYDPKWGPAVNNKLGWVLMESPVFVAMLLLWLLSDRRHGRHFQRAQCLDARRLDFLLFT